MVGSQRVKKSLQNPQILDAISLGRVISFDFAFGNSRLKPALSTVDDVFSFFQKLMIFFLCNLFHGRQVDGINFERIETVNSVHTYIGHQKEFNDWKKKCLNFEICDTMIDEYIRLTNIAFNSNSQVPPVFLLDEIQGLSKTTNRASTYDRDNVNRYHTLLSLLLTQLAGKHKPICICTGTDDGDLSNTTEMSQIAPEMLSLHPLVNDYRQYWQELTKFENQERGLSISVEERDQVMDALIHASCKIPRLLRFAHEVWYDHKSDPSDNKVFYLEAFEKKALTFYRQTFEIVWKLSTNDLSHLVFTFL